MDSYEERIALMKLITVIFLSLGLVGCTPYYNPKYPNHIYAHKVRNDFIRFATQDKHLKVHGTGGGMFETINSMNVLFFYDKILTIDEARVLFVKLNENFLYRVNTELKDNLKIYPAPVNDFYIDIIVADQYGSFPPQETVASILISNEKKIRYTTPPPNKNSCDIVILYEEPYEEALKIVREQHLEVLPPNDYLINAQNCLMCE